MTLTQLLSAIQTNVNRTDKDAAARTGVQLAVEKVLSAHSFRATRVGVDIDFTAGDSSVQLPSDLVNIREARWLTNLTSTQSWPIIIKTKDWIVQRFPNVASLTTSYPYIGYIEGGVFNTVPGATVDGILRITYDRTQVFENDDASTIIPICDEAIIAFGTAWVLKSLMLFAEASQWEMTGDRALMRAITVDDRDNEIFGTMNSNSGVDQPFIEPYLNPFAGLRRSWYFRG